MRIAAAVLILALGACTTTTDPLPPAVTGCAGVAVAEPEAEPQEPALSPEKVTAVYQAILRALGETTGRDYVRHYEVTHPAWGRRQAARLDAVRAECATLQQAPTR